MKRIDLIFYRQNHIRKDWEKDLDSDEFKKFIDELSSELLNAKTELSVFSNDSFTININSYHDILNSVRVSSPKDNLANVCIGHIIGKSESLDFFEDVRKGVRRAAFAPETIEPDSSSKRVCHNCGCGC